MAACAVGRQKNSLKPSAGAFSFGTASRGQYNKVFLTKQLEQKKTNSCTPGPIYAHPTTIGRSTPRYRFGTAPKLPPLPDPCGDSSMDVASSKLDTQRLKFHKSSNAVFGYESRDNTRNGAVIQVNPQQTLGVQSPGPSAYSPNDAVITKNAPHMTFKNSSDRKIASSSAASTPRHVGPGSYPVPHQKPKSVFSFGKSVRPGRQSENIPPDGDVLGGTTSSMGKQLTSREKTSANYGFGSSTREKKDKTFLVQTIQDKAQQQRAHATLPHPTFAPEPERIRYS